MFNALYGGLNGDDFGPPMGHEFDGIDGEHFTPNELFYHSRFYGEFLSETDKAYLLEDSVGMFWIPKKLVKIKGDSWYIWDKFKIKYIGESK